MSNLSSNGDSSGL